MLNTDSPLSPVKKLAIEVVFLVAAVFFALAVDEAWEDYENRELSKVALSRIYQELFINRKQIINGSAHHKLLIERLQPAIDQLLSGNSLPDDIDYNFESKIAVMRDTAWRSAQLADVLKYIPYDQIEELRTAYGVQELYQAQASRVIGIQTEVEFIKSDASVQFRALFKNILQTHSMEKALLSAYTKIELDAEDAEEAEEAEEA